VSAQTFADERVPALGLKLLGGVEHPVQLVDPGSQHRVRQRRVVDRRTDQAGVQLAGIQVQHAFAEALRPHRPAVVRDARRQERHQRAQRAVLVAVEAVADHAVVDDQQRPRVVGVRRVRVRGEPSVEHLVDAPHGGPPRGDVRHG
jgi:hypothetical protein